MNALLSFIDHSLAQRFSQGYHFVLLSAENASSITRNDFSEFLGENGVLFHYEDVNEIVNHDYGLFYNWYNEDMQILKEIGSRHLSHYLNLDAVAEDGGQFALIPELSFNNTRNMIVVFENSSDLISQITETARFLRLHCDYSSQQTHCIITGNDNFIEGLINQFHNIYNSPDIGGERLYIYFNSDEFHTINPLCRVNQNFINKLNTLLSEGRFSDVMTELSLHELSSTQQIEGVSEHPRWGKYLHWYNFDRI